MKSIKIKYKGIWLFGYSGTGKSFVSKKIKNKVDRSIEIDGDQVRKYISFDLGYSLRDRETQIKRVFGILSITLKSKLFPIVSTVYLNKHIADKLHKKKILVIKMNRKKKFFSKKKTYKENKKDVVGVDIKFKNNFKYKELFNNGDEKVCLNLMKLIK